MPEPRLRVFIDSNVIFSGFLSPNGAPAEVLVAVREGRFHAVLSRKVLEEVTRNLRAKVPAVLPAFLAWVERYEPELVRDASEVASQRWHDLGLGQDSEIIASALGAQVDYICTGDRAFREVVTLHVDKRLVVTPRELVNLIT